MAWVTGERHAWHVGGRVFRPRDEEIAGVVDALDLSWPPSMDQLAAAKQALRSLATVGEVIDVTWDGRLYLVLVVIGVGGISWVVEIAEKRAA